MSRTCHPAHLRTPAPSETLSTCTKHNNTNTKQNPDPDSYSDMFPHLTEEVVKKLGTNSDLISNDALNKKWEMLKLVKIGTRSFFSYFYPRPKYTCYDLTLMDIVDENICLEYEKEVLVADLKNFSLDNVSVEAEGDSVGAQGKASGKNEDSTSPATLMSEGIRQRDLAELITRPQECSKLKPGFEDRFKLMEGEKLAKVNQRVYNTSSVKFKSKTSTSWSIGATFYSFISGTSEIFAEHVVQENFNIVYYVCNHTEAFSHISTVQRVYVLNLLSNTTSMLLINRSRTTDDGVDGHSRIASLCSTFAYTLQTGPPSPSLGLGQQTHFSPPLQDTEWVSAADQNEAIQRRPGETPTLLRVANDSLSSVDELLGLSLLSPGGVPLPEDAFIESHVALALDVKAEELVAGSLLHLSASDVENKIVGLTIDGEPGPYMETRPGLVEKTEVTTFTVPEQKVFALALKEIKMEDGFLDPNRMIPPTTDLADKQKADALDRWVQRQKEEAMRNLPKDLEVLPSQLLLEQMECEAVQRRSPPAPLAAHSGPAVKSSPSSRRKKRQRGAPSCVSAGEESLTAAAVMSGVGTPLLAGGRAAARKPASLPATAPSPRLAAPPPMPSSLAPAQCSEATPDELEEQLRFFARQIKTFRKTSLTYSSPELMERIRQMEEDYGTAVRTPGSCAAAAAEQSTPGLQGAAAAAAAEQSSPGLQGAAAAAEQSTPGLQGAAAAAAAEQSTPGLQGALLLLLQSSPRQDSRELLLLEHSHARLRELLCCGNSTPGPEHLLSFLWGVLMELKPDTHHDTPQPVSARPDTPQPVSARPDTPKPDSPQPDLKSASTSSTRRRGRRKRDASVHATGGLCDASALAHATEGLCDASAPAHATEGLCDASAPAHVTEGSLRRLSPCARHRGSLRRLSPCSRHRGSLRCLSSAHATEGLCDASAPAHATEGLCDASAPAHATEGLCDSSAPSLQGSVGNWSSFWPLNPATRGTGEKPLPICLWGLQRTVVLVLASEPLDEGIRGEHRRILSLGLKGQFVLVLARSP
ncbi:hypothetical protein CRENBAI_010471 [Crenichthys baileyi]|uniref:Gasdermin pore forming domain-containing protein n=1 Tax=Crenichthys baileyi TaxID=28760 RepID=A0AAV9SQQ4_9TELE